MSRQILQPNYCSCTVHQARNLPDKGKSNGIDAFCTISMGKEKFVTAVKEKTRAPLWDEQCDMQITEDATIKLTVYHNTKSALSKGDFVGRAYVSLRDLQDYDHVHRRWYKLNNKEGKADKERGEIDVSLQFYSKNNATGSVLDLTTKKKHLSLKDIKQSLGSKLKSASKHRKQDNYSGDNQLAEQRRRLGGGDDSTFNVRDFLDDSASETASNAGSHMSLNSMSYTTNAELQHKKSMSLNRGETDRMSSIRSSVKRKIQPKDDIMQQSFSELESPAHNNFMNGFNQNQSSSFVNRTDRNAGTTLPDIVGEQSLKSARQGLSQNPVSSSINQKPNDNGLCVLGYQNVKSTPVHPKIRQELDYLDREELLHVIAFQADLLKKRDARVKDLESYTDSLLVKILEQCPTILQVGASSSTSSYRR